MVAPNCASNADGNIGDVFGIVMAYVAPALRAQVPDNYFVNDCFPQSSTAAVGRPETVVGGLQRCCLGSPLEVSVRPSPAVGDPPRISLAGSSWVTGLRRPT